MKKECVRTSLLFVLDLFLRKNYLIALLSQE
jgi:hypothetical protein